MKLHSRKLISPLDPSPVLTVSLLTLRGHWGWHSEVPNIYPSVVEFLVGMQLKTIALPSPEPISSQWFVREWWALWAPPWSMTNCWQVKSCAGPIYVTTVTVRPWLQCMCHTQKITCCGPHSYIIGLTFFPPLFLWCSLKTQPTFSLSTLGSHKSLHLLISLQR